MNTKTLIAAGILTAVSSQAGAFSFDQDSIFANFAVDGSFPGETIIGVAGTAHLLEEFGTPGFKSIDWNHVNNGQTQSSLTIANSQGDLVEGTWTEISLLTHVNSTIDAGQTPGFNWSGDILSNLRLFSDDGGTNLIFSDYAPLGPGSEGFGSESIVAIDFEETFNSAPCAYPGGVACADRFDFTGDLDDIYFSLGAMDYLLEFRLVGSGGVTIVGSGDGFVITNEELTNTLGVEMRLTFIPEPAMLALMGIGLVGFGITARRKTNS